MDVYIWSLDATDGQQWKGRQREQTCGHGWGRHGWDELREEP